MQITIRPFAPGDETALWQVFYDAIHQLAAGDYTLAQLDAWAPPQPDWERWTARMRGLAPWLAVCEGRILGYADVQPSGYVDHFYVAPAHARRGIGSQLMRHLHQVARNQELPRLFADVSLTARPFFERWEFQIEAAQSVKTRGEILTNYRMVKILSPASLFRGGVEG